MFYKYYTADLLTIDGMPLKCGSLTVKVWLFTSPSIVAEMITNVIERDGLEGHKFYNLRRIK